MNILNAEQRAACDEDGFVVLRGLLDPARDLDRVITCPMQRGDVLFMHRRTCHSSLHHRWQSDDPVCA